MNKHFSRAYHAIAPALVAGALLATPVRSEVTDLDIPPPNIVEFENTIVESAMQDTTLTTTALRVACYDHDLSNMEQKSLYTMLNSAHEKLNMANNIVGFHAYSLNERHEGLRYELYRSLDGIDLSNRRLEDAVRRFGYEINEVERTTTGQERLMGLSALSVLAVGAGVGISALRRRRR